MRIDIPQKILLEVEKPARYIGNEMNMVKKNPEDVDIRFAYCFPDVYEVGMSHIGSTILYHFLNEREDTYCERVYSPWHDMEEKMRENNIPMYALETYTPIKEFDFLGFTLQYEMSYTNILNILDLGGIPKYSKDRTEEDPLVIAGGPCAYNPEPLAPFVDFFYIGEGEVLYYEILDLYKAIRSKGGSKEDFLEKVLQFEGVYVPKFYDVQYKENGEIESFTPNHPDAKEKIKKVHVKDVDNSYYPTNPIMPLIQVVHDRAVIELFRGCIRGCRFCQAGMIYRPVRQKDPKKLAKLADDILGNTGYEEVSLISLSSSDYTDLNEITDHLFDKHCDVNLSLPSLRVDEFSLDLMDRLSKGKKSSLTFAPEAGTQRLRDVINKNISEDDILSGVALAFKGGWDKVKLYFMMGLPTETMEDISGIKDLAYSIVDQYFGVPKEERARNLKVTVSTSFFVPKPFTPFQWFPQNTYDEFMAKQALLNSEIRNRKIQYNCHDAKLSALEGIVARGDRRVADVIYHAWKNGSKFDGWSDHFVYDKWVKAFEECNIDGDFYHTRERSYDEILPWDFINIGVTKAFLWKEFEKAINEEVTPNCREKCSNCGVSKIDKGACYEKEN
ncbi:TIGR03960 family B12-binding radical SAM protein [Vallitalea okinawensis]|uniref:TIGR03960 family B12-binding radical SAM protein n=1 Tax=Vallitalea okinawensis TaxID=2078660 RepID=UPI000CFC85D9|nr:TIGR03960 family B12-binding radical SAM protein [Vallitalea okinawensis]